MLSSLTRKGTKMIRDRLLMLIQQAVHDDLRWKERKEEERQAPETNEKMKNELPQVGCTCTFHCT